MKAMVTKSKYGGVADGLTGLMTRAQALRLKDLAKEAYQPVQYAIGLSFEEAAPDRCAQGRNRSGGLFLGESGCGLPLLAMGEAPRAANGSIDGSPFSTPLTCGAHDIEQPGS